MARQAVRRNAEKAPSPNTALPESGVRSRIFREASKLVREQGPNAVTARAICDASGIKAPTLYHYFGDLNGLYSEILASLFEEYIEEGPPDEVAEPIAMIKDVWGRMMHHAQKEPGIISLMNRQLSDCRLPDVMQASRRRMEAAFEQLSGRIPMKVSPRQAAHMFWAAAHGMASLIAASGYGVPYPEGTAEALRAAVLLGIFGVDDFDALDPRNNPVGSSMPLT